MSETTSRRLTVEKTQDEFGQDRYFVANEKADWIDGPFDTAEEALERIWDIERER